MDGLIDVKAALRIVTAIKKYIIAYKLHYQFENHIQLYCYTKYTLSKS